MASSICFNELSEEITFKCFQNLGGREALCLTAVCKVWREQLGPSNDTMWKTFGAQEFGDTNLQAPPAPKDTTTITIGFTGVDRYASLARAASLQQALWGQVPTQGFGAREGTPHLFLGRTGKEIFAFGGYGSRGPSNDLAAASLCALKELLSTTSAGIVVEQSSSASSSALRRSSSASGGTATGEPASATEGAPSDAAPAEQALDADEPIDELAPRLEFVQVDARGAPPLPSYGATLTPLVDDELPGCEWMDLDDVQRCITDSALVAQLPRGSAAATSSLILVTGGYRSGGYRNESPDWSIGIVPPLETDSSSNAADQSSSVFQPPPRTQQAQQPRRVYWTKPGPAFLDDGETRNGPTARSNASAVFVPARFADSFRFPKGYVMLFGGNVERRASNTIDILDLSTFIWTFMDSLPNAPTGRNSHGAVLMPDASEPGTRATILIFGGANGGDIPRGGQDFSDFAAFDPRRMEWLGCTSNAAVPGRAHVSVKIGRSVLFFGGGQMPTEQLSAVDCQHLTELSPGQLASGLDSGSTAFQMRSELLQSLPWKVLRSVGEGSPAPRAFHAAVSLAPAGVPVLLTYGGWHPRRGNFGDVWAAKLDAWDTSKSGGGGVGERAQKADRRFSEVLALLEEQEEEDDDDDEERMTGPFVNIGGRLLPLDVFANMVRSQVGAEEASRVLAALMRQGQGQQAGGQDQESDDEEDDDDDQDSVDEGQVE